ncbi:hypothetical protein ACFLY9_00305 [Patescibacteria group bacterium]
MEIPQQLKDLGDRIFNPKRWGERLSQIREEPSHIRYLIKRTFQEISGMLLTNEYKAIESETYNLFGLEVTEFTFNTRRERTSHISIIKIPSNANWDIFISDNKTHPTKVTISESSELIFPGAFIDIATGDPLYGVYCNDKIITEFKFTDPESQIGAIAITNEGQLLIFDYSQLQEALKPENLNKYKAIQQVPILLQSNSLEKSFQDNPTLTHKTDATGVLQIATPTYTNQYILYPSTLKRTIKTDYAIRIENYNHAIDKLAKENDWKLAILDLGRTGIVMREKDNERSVGLHHLRKLWNRITWR